MITKKWRILFVVDDKDTTLKPPEALLVQQEYECVFAKNGIEALEIIKELPIDLVLLDVTIPTPEMDIFDVCQRIKEDEFYRNIPVIMLASSASRQHRIRSIEAGADDFISKPFDVGEVLARIKMLLKTKSMNDGLSRAYSNIINMVSFGKQAVKPFKESKFGFMSKVDSIVKNMIRQSRNSLEKPQVMIFGIRNESDLYNWYRYRYVFRDLERTPIDLDMEWILNIPDGDNTKIGFLNGDELMKSSFAPLVKRLETTFSISVSNMVSCLSSNICVFAINYGADVTRYDAKVLESFVAETLFLQTLFAHVKDTDDAFVYTVQTLVRASEANDDDTGNHILRVGEYCALIAQQLGMSKKFTNIIQLQGQMHDVGKIHIPAAILKKPAKLTPEELEEMRKHTIYGTKILGNHSRLTMATEIALSHHERWDGSGYPYALKGEQIPLPGRIVNIADQYDALRNQRVYKPAFDHKETFKIITEGDGRTMPFHFDPAVLKAFKDVHNSFEEVYANMA